MITINGTSYTKQQVRAALTTLQRGRNLLRRKHGFTTGTMHEMKTIAGEKYAAYCAMGACRKGAGASPFGGAQDDTPRLRLAYELLVETSGRKPNPALSHAGSIITGTNDNILKSQNKVVAWFHRAMRLGNKLQSA